MCLQLEETTSVPDQPDGTYGCAILTFDISEAGEYILKAFCDPKSSADYETELMSRFATAAERTAKNYVAIKSQLFTRCRLLAGDCINNREAGSVAQPGGVTYSAIIDSISYDLDGDGREESCTITYGPTSGLFSFCLNVFPAAGEENEETYRETYVLIGTGVEAPGELSFHVTKENLQLKAVEESYGGETTTTVYFDLVWQYGEVVLREAN
jgi:hypothetical protein